MPCFKELGLGEAFALANGTSPAWRTIFRKIGNHTARDDRGGLYEIEASQEVERLGGVDVTHALWVRAEDTLDEEPWRLVLRWQPVATEEPRWLSVDPAEQASEESERRARSLLASALQAQGEPTQALRIYDELLEEREEPALLNNRGAARAALGEVDGAIEDYTRAIELDPTLAQAFSNRGNALTKRGDYALAIEDYDRALELAGDVAAIYTNRGLTRKLLGDVEGGLVDFERAISCDDSFGPSYLARGGLRAVRGDIRGAVRDLERFLELAPHAVQAEQVRLALDRLRGEERRA